MTEDQVPDPNGLCFSPDYKKLYVVSTGKGPGDSGPGGKGDVFVFDVGADNKLSNGKRFSDFTIDGVKCVRIRRGPRDGRMRAGTASSMMALREGQAAC